MATVKIILDKEETELEAQILLHKALSHQLGITSEVEESFDDPAMIHLSQKLEETHAKIYQEMLTEILEALDEDYSEW